MSEHKKFRVTIRPYDASFECAADETLLQGSRKSGLFLFTNCQRGECGTCMVKIRKGRINLEPFMLSALSISEIDDGYTLACRSYPRTDLVIAAELAGYPQARFYARDD